MISPVSILGVIILIFCYLQLFIIIIEDPYQSLFIYQISNELYMVLLLTNYAITIIDKEPLNVDLRGLQIRPGGCRGTLELCI